MKLKGTSELSYTETLRRLRLFFPDGRMQVTRVTAERAAELYQKFAEGRSVDYHRNTLAEAKSFMRFCAANGWAREGAIDKVQGTGRRSAGKAQLTGDEARAFWCAALELADAGDLGALGAALLLSMGLRQSEVTKRRVRDLDLDGTVLRIPQGKTKRARRAVSIPPALRPHLLRLTKKRDALEVLFPSTAKGGEHTKTWLRKAVLRVCKKAKVTDVCPHGLRGTHATLAEEAGVVSLAVASALGHESVSTTHGHYASPEAVAGAKQGRTLKVISGGPRQRR